MEKRSGRISLIILHRCDLSLREAPSLLHDCGWRQPDRQLRARIPRRLKCRLLVRNHRESYELRAVGERPFGNPQARDRSWLDAAKQPLAPPADQIDVNSLNAEVVEAEGLRTGGRNGIRHRARWRVKAGAERKRDGDCGGY